MKGLVQFIVFGVLAVICVITIVAYSTVKNLKEWQYGLLVAGIMFSALGAFGALILGFKALAAQTTAAQSTPAEHTPVSV